MATQNSQQPWTCSVQWATWISWTGRNQATSPWQCYNNQAPGKAGKTGLLHRLSVKYKRKPQGLMWDAVWPSCLLSRSRNIDGCMPRTSAISYMSFRVDTHVHSRHTQVFWMSSVSQAELLPQPGRQTSGISRQVFKILKLYVDKISGRQRECMKGEV